MSDTKKSWWEGLDCGRCGIRLTSYPALSRIDNTTAICSECGTMEALADWRGHMSSLPPLTPQEGR